MTTIDERPTPLDQPLAKTRKTPVHGMQWKLIASKPPDFLKPVFLCKLTPDGPVYDIGHLTGIDLGKVFTFECGYGEDGQPLFIDDWTHYSLPTVPGFN